MMKRLKTRKYLQKINERREKCLLKWASYCIENQSLKPPEEEMYVKTLPKKENYFMNKSKQPLIESIKGCTAHGGMFALGALHELSK